MKSAVLIKFTIELCKYVLISSLKMAKPVILLLVHIQKSH